MTSRLIPGRYPPPGASSIADHIRKRRGAQGLIPLDGALLHFPALAEGWNALGSALRDNGNLPGDVRELMILRVAACTHAAFEWIQHEPIGRSHGLSTQQLHIIRDTSTPLPPSNPGTFNPLQEAALLFADESTRNVKVSPEVVERLIKELGVLSATRSKNEITKEDEVHDLLVEAAAVVGCYNMVSRFLVALDIAGMADDPVPWPVEHQQGSVSAVPSTSPTTSHFPSTNTNQHM